MPSSSFSVDAAVASARTGVAPVPSRFDSSHSNASGSISGRYPNVGPQILNEAGIPLLDAVGPRVMQLHDGDLLRLDDEGLWRGDTRIAAGHLLDAEAIQALMHEARAGLAVQIEAFATNTMEYIRKERELLLDGIGIPAIRTRIHGRHTLVVRATDGAVPRSNSRLN